jgi:urease accessory protein
MSRVQGRLHLDFDRLGGGTTRLLVREATPPLRVIRAFELADGAAMIHLHNVSGGVLGGDHLEMSVRVGAGAQAQVTTTSATRVYRSRGQRAVQTNTIQVAEGGLLEMLPDPVIPFAASDYQQITRVQLAEGAGLFWWEVIAPGREARGERFAYNRLMLETEIHACGRPIALECSRLEPGLRPLAALSRLGTYHYFAAFYICRVGMPSAAWNTLESELAELASSLTQSAEIQWGVSTLAAHGLVVRSLSQNSRGILKGLTAFWDKAKRSLYGREAIPPRKIY